MCISDELPSPDPAEVASFRYVDTDALIRELTERPDEYTAWFKICLEKVLELYYKIV
jgi:isopentenyl-diphosphate delta-isomerase